MNKFECHITVHSDKSTVLSELSSQCALSNSAIKQAINKGALWLSKGNHTQRLRRIKKTLSIGDQLHFYYDESILSQQPTPAQLIADLQDYSIWYKPYGMLSQGSKWSDHCAINRWVQGHLTPERPVFIVHRLDRAATGLMLLAHSKKAARALSTMFENRELEKHYQIIVHGNHQNRSQPDVITKTIDDKKAKSTFTCLNYHADEELSSILVKIDSGRKHQIRLHAASIDMPVVGDRLHGNTEKVIPEELNLQLCAVSLKFTCPITTKEQHFVLNDALKPNVDDVVTLLQK